MPYQATARTRAKKADNRRRILAAARALVAEGGYAAAQVAAVASAAGVATVGAIDNVIGTAYDDNLTGSATANELTGGAGVEYSFEAIGLGAAAEQANGDFDPPCAIFGKVGRGRH